MPDLEVQVLGRARQVAFVRSHVPSDVGLVDRSYLERLDDRLWLVGEIRLDGATDLRRRLASSGVAAVQEARHARLCLLAYDRWKERCLDFIAGDFAFAIWDEARQSLFAAGDRLGKRQLFHGRSGSVGVVANSLDWAAQQAAPGRVVDEYWIADFLTLGWSREPHRTVYRDIARLPPAHALTWTGTGTEIRRYWQLELTDPLYLPREVEYLERFRALVTEAIADRAPPGEIGISMSGGLDSTTLAALAARLIGDPRKVKATCIHLEAVPQPREDLFATMAAQHLGIDLQIVLSDDKLYDPLWQSRGIRSSEPTCRVFDAHYTRQLNDAQAARAPVWLEGEGPDNALSLDRNAYLSWLVQRRAWRRLASTAVSYAKVKGGRGWLQSIRRHTAPQHPDPVPDYLPRWIDPGFDSRLRLRERIEDLGVGGSPSHPWHPDAYRSFTSTIWQSHFSRFAFEEALSPIHWEHPYVDLRVLNFMLRVPPIPWAWEKSLLRKAMRQWLPSPVLKRPKAPLQGLPHAAAAARLGIPPLLAPARLAAYVDARLLPAPDAPTSHLEQSLGANALDYWLATSAAG